MRQQVGKSSSNQLIGERESPEYPKTYEAAFYVFLFDYGKKWGMSVNV